MIICSCLCISHLFFLSQGEKGATGSSDIIDFNGKLLDAFQVNDIKVSDLWMHHIIVILIIYQEFFTEFQVRHQAFRKAQKW